MNATGKQPSTPISSRAEKSKTLIVYHYFEQDQTYIENLLHFLTFGYSVDHDYLIVIAGSPSFNLPAFDNVRYLRTANLNNDYGGYCAAVTRDPDDFLCRDHLIFVNSSVRGPFLPSWCARRWTDVFLERLTGEVGLVGSTINILSPQSEYTLPYEAKYGGKAPYAHVQTMAYAMPQRSFRLLYDHGFYAVRPELGKANVIEDYEIRMSRLMIEAGLNIAALLPEYGLDYRAPTVNEVCPTSLHGDVIAPHAYFGRTLHPFESIFIKTHRGLVSPAYLDRLSYGALCRGAVDETLLARPVIAAYVRKLSAAATRRERVPDGPPFLAPEEVFHYMQVLLKEAPQFRGEMARLLASVPTA